MNPSLNELAQKVSGKIMDDLKHLVQYFLQFFKIFRCAGHLPDTFPIFCQNFVKNDLKMHMFLDWLAEKKTR